MTLQLDRPVRVRVPATAANLGPGFDALGLALNLYDEVVVEAVDGGGVEVTVEGEGADSVPLDESHLVVRTILRTLRAAGAARPGLRLHARNAVPHGRGLGSSAAAVVAGLLAGRALLGRPRPAVDLLPAATALEGHPDNAAAALLGGLTIAWVDSGVAQAIRVDPHPDLRVVACVPATRLATEQARGLLPTTVPHADAAFTVGRAALLVEAVTRHPELLLPATADRLHQQQRRAAMPNSLALVDALRAAGLAAVISGAGPAVAVLAAADVSGTVRRIATGWDVHDLAVAEGATVLES